MDGTYLDITWLSVSILTGGCILIVHLLLRMMMHLTGVSMFGALRPIFVGILEKIDHS